MDDRARVRNIRTNAASLAFSAENKLGERWITDLVVDCCLEARRNVTLNGVELGQLSLWVTALVFLPFSSLRLQKQLWKLFLDCVWVGMFREQGARAYAIGTFFLGCALGAVLAQVGLFTSGDWP